MRSGDRALQSPASATTPLCDLGMSFALLVSRHPHPSKAGVGTDEPSLPLPLALCSPRCPSPPRSRSHTSEGGKGRRGCLSWAKAGAGDSQGSSPTPPGSCPARPLGAAPPRALLQTTEQTTKQAGGKFPLAFCPGTLGAAAPAWAGRGPKSRAPTARLPRGAGGGPAELPPLSPPTAQTGAVQPAEGRGRQGAAMGRAGSPAQSPELLQSSSPESGWLAGPPVLS